MSVACQSHKIRRTSKSRHLFRLTALSAGNVQSASRLSPPPNEGGYV